MPKARLFAFFCCLFALCSCKPAPIENDVHMANITYSTVQYVAASSSEPAHVRVLSQDSPSKSTEYYDYGSSSCDARCQFDAFYIKAYNQSGVVSWCKQGDIRVIARACAACTSMPDPLDTPTDSTDSTSQP